VVAKTPKRQYVKLDYAMLHSQQWKALSPVARDVYVQIKAARNLKNSRGRILNRTDDYIKFGFKDSGGMSKPTYHRAIKELVDNGFIGVMDPGGIPNRKAAYAIIDDWQGQGSNGQMQASRRALYGGLEERMYWD
jgi:hypothetical protein